MTSTQREAKKRKVERLMDSAAKRLAEALVTIHRLNEDGEQYDYCTAPALSNMVDRVDNLVKSIDKVVYQK